MADHLGIQAGLGDRAERNVPIGPLTTYRVGGAADLLVRVATSADLAAVAEVVCGTDIPVLIIGRGSNLLVADDGFAGLVVLLGDEFAAVTIHGTTVRAGAAASLPVVARQTAAAGLTGFEWAVGVPGSIGGAVRMNAGGHGADMAASVVAAEVVDLASGTVGSRSAHDLQFGYRHSSIQSSEVVVAATLDLAEGDRVRAEAEISEVEYTPPPPGGTAEDVSGGDTGGSSTGGQALEGAEPRTILVESQHLGFP